MTQLNAKSQLVIRRVNKLLDVETQGSQGLTVFMKVPWLKPHRLNQN